MAKPKLKNLGTGWCIHLFFNHGRSMESMVASELPETGMLVYLMMMLE
jgi:hypothetical protein